MRKEDAAFHSILFSGIIEESKRVRFEAHPFGDTGL